MHSSFTKKVFQIMLIFLLLNMQMTVVLANENWLQVKPATQGRNFTAGDGLLVNTYPDTTSFIHRSYPIDDMGMVDFPIIGRINVTNLSDTQLEDFLKNEYRSYLKTPNVQVKPLIRISVLGGVNRPGLYYVDSQSSLWEILRIAGGTVFETGVKDMTWERGDKKISDNLIASFERGTSLSRMGIRSGDQLWTPSTQETFWDVFRVDVLPILAFTTSVAFLYLSYQQTLLLRTR